jgi:hypothetical protein
MNFLAKRMWWCALWGCGVVCCDLLCYDGVVFIHSFIFTLPVWLQGEDRSALYILGGDQDGAGTLQDVVFRGENGLLCDINGIVCGGL